MDDLISRSGLIAELESFKVVTGDPVIRVIVDRIIGIVRAHPGKEVPGHPVVKDCESCIHGGVHPEDEPCTSCVQFPGAMFPNWEGNPDDC